MQGTFVVIEQLNVSIHPAPPPAGPWRAIERFAAVLTIAVALGVPTNSPMPVLACTRAKPTVTATPTQGPSVQAGTTVLYTVSVKNNDSGPCTASTFALQTTVPTGWHEFWTTPNVSLSPGASTSTALKVTSPAPAPGSYTIVGVATASAR